MRVLALMLALSCASASAQAAHRGWLTGAGLMLAGAGAVSVALGAYSAAQGDAAAHAVTAYYSNGAAPTSAEASTVRWLQERSEGQGSLGLALLIGGGAAVLVGVSIVLFDGWFGGTSVSLSIQPTRTSVLISGDF